MSNQTNQETRGPMGFSPTMPKTDNRQNVDDTEIRSAYYSASDGLYQLNDATGMDSATMDDEKLAKLVQDAQNALDAVHQHLEAGYRWD